ncbi:hypothetical protein ACN6Q1_04355 [Acinetobacter baumannii]
MAHITRFKVKEGTDVDARDFMPHEERPENDDELSLDCLLYTSDAADD